jgi:hypothetical protein
MDPLCQSHSSMRRCGFRHPETDPPLATTAAVMCGAEHCHLPPQSYPLASVSSATIARAHSSTFEPLHHPQSCGEPPRGRLPQTDGDCSSPPPKFSLFPGRFFPHRRGCNRNERFARRTRAWHRSGGCVRGIGSSPPTEPNTHSRNPTPFHGPPFVVHFRFRVPWSGQY